MYASRKVRWTAVLLSILTVFSLLAVDTAEARRGGSFGSRGTRTYQTVPATPTSPTTTGPVNRSMNSGPTVNNGVGTNYGTQPRGWFGGGLLGGLGGALLGGLLFSGLFGMLFGGGFGGGGGLIALLFQVVIIGLIVSWFLRRRRPAAQTAYGSPYQSTGPGNGNGNGNGMNGMFGQNGGGMFGGGGNGMFGQGRGPASAASQRAGRRDEIGITDADLSVFENRLVALQNDYAREDYDALRRIATPEMMSYLAEELGTNARNGVRNEVYDVRLLSGDVAEAWREGSAEYASVAMRYESRDVTREKATGRIVSGDDSLTETTEVWTFVRTPGTQWLVSAIQET